MFLFDAISNMAGTLVRPWALQIKAELPSGKS